MNVLFLSPNFPPNFERFCTALKEAGARVLGVGDAPFEALSDALKWSLTEYCHVHNMSEYESLYRAAAYLISRHGRLDRLDSQTEHWLGLEARLRQDFNVFGQKPEDLEFNRRKSGMKEIFRQAGVPTPAGEPVVSADQVRAFWKKHGLPLIFKPDVGVGAARIFRVDRKEQLIGVLDYPPKDFLVEAFAGGTLMSFDGLTDREGGIVFCASHVVNSGIMEIVTEQRPVHYYYQREIPPKLEELGRRAVAAFRLRERFFHLEFFVTGEECLALEINVRPPGGMSIDMMNWSCDVDLYRVWADLLVRGEGFFRYERLFNVAHAARRSRYRYRRSHEELLAELGPMLVSHQEFPKVFSTAMGDYVYFLRHPDLGELKRGIALVEELA